MKSRTTIAANPRRFATRPRRGKLLARTLGTAAVGAPVGDSADEQGREFTLVEIRSTK